MTFETGNAVDLEDLLSKLDTFAQTTHGGWASIYSPNPDTTNRWFELKKGSLSFSMRYPAGVTDGDTVSIHHATGSSSSATAPGAHTADSGNGYNVGTGGTSANFATERCVRSIGNGPFPSYHFFADDTAPNDYIHVVVQPVTGMFRHILFGSLVKFGDDWTGGEYVCGHYQDAATIAAPTDLDTNLLIDGLTTSAIRSATVRIGGAGLLNIGAGVWGVAAALPSASLLTDTAGNVRRQIHGTYRAGMEPRGFGDPVGAFSSGVIPMTSIGAYYRDPSNPRVQLLGYMPDVRQINVRNFEAGQEISVGVDTWVVFPQSIRTTASVANRSAFAGVAYRKVV